MAYCLKTQLRAIVNNPDLPLLNSVIVTFLSNSGGFCDLRTLSATTDVLVECLTPNVKLALNYGDGTVISDTVIKIHGNTGAYGFKVLNQDDTPFASSAVQVKLTSKHDVYAIINGIVANMKDLAYMQGITEINATTNATIAAGMSGDVSVIKTTPLLKKVNLSNTLVGGNIDELSELTNIHTLIFGGGSVTGNIKNLPKFVASGGTMGFGDHATISGSIEEFVAKQRTVNVEGSMMFNKWSGNITFNGEIVSNGIGALSWTSSTITYRGVTINA